jgi:ABC-2 type transport system ATP-binding protein/lipopolysaccharide transport system ATP-binding protein
MCTKALVLSKGESVFFGDVDAGFDFYERMG